MTDRDPAECRCQSLTGHGIDCFMFDSWIEESSGVVDLWRCTECNEDVQDCSCGEEPKDELSDAEVALRDWERVGSGYDPLNAGDRLYVALRLALRAYDELKSEYEDLQRAVRSIGGLE